MKTNSKRGDVQLTTVAHGALGIGGAGLMLMLASTGYSPAALAEEADARNSLEEVLVTARRREESAQTVPISITAVDGETLDNLQINNIENLQTVAPELSVSAASGRPGTPVYGLRGIRPTEAIYGQDPTVAVYFADFVLSPADGSNLGIYDLASVQVLKGPQGTLFGRNTTGGAILFTPQRPGDKFGGTATFGFGSYGRTEAQLAVDLPVSDTFALRFAGRTIHSDGFQTNRAPGPRAGNKLAGEDSQSLRLSAVWNITDAVENYTVISWDDRDTTGRGMRLEALNPATNVKCYDGPTNPNGLCFIAPGVPAAGEPLPSIFDALARAQGRDIKDVESDMPQFDRTKVWSVINTTTVEINDDLTLKSIAGYRDFNTNSSLDIDSSPVPGLLTAGPLQTNTLEHASYELQLLGSAFDDRLDWVTGLYWYKEKGYSLSPGDVFLGINPNNPFSQRADIDNQSYSGFAQGTFKLTDQWSITAGARWTQDEKDMTVLTRTPAGCSLRDPNTGLPIPSTAPCKVDLSDSFSQPTGTVSLDFKPTDGMLVYAASRLGYRSGGFNLRAVRPLEYQPFDPETVIDFELGTKLDWDAGPVRMRTNLAVYHQWYDDIQRTVAVTNPDGVPGSAVQNAAKAKVLGAELEQTISPTRDLSLQINYAYTDPQYGEWTQTVAGPGGTTITSDLSDTPFHFTPKHSGRALLTYLVPLDEAGELRFTANGSYRSQVWINSLQNILAIRATPTAILPALQQEAYWLLDLGAGWDDVMGTPFDVSVYVKNATDEEYAVGGVQLYTTFGLTTKAYGDPRTWGMELRYQF